MKVRGLWAATLALGLSGASLGACSDATSGRNDAGVDDAGDAFVPCALTLTRLNGRDVDTVAKLGVDDDLDESAPGIQVDIEVAVAGRPQGDQVRLSVTGLAPDPTSSVLEGKANFEDVTVGATLNNVLIRAFGIECAQDNVALVVEPSPECFFELPVAGAGLGPRDDKATCCLSDAQCGSGGSCVEDLCQVGTCENDTFDIDVIVGTNNATGGTLALRIGDTLLAAVDVESDGRVRFDDVVVPLGPSVALSGELTVDSTTRTCVATISVAGDMPACAISIDPTPVVSLSDGNALRKSQDQVPGTPGIEVNISATTESRVDQVVLFVDDIPVKTVQPEGGQAIFSAQPLEDGARVVKATCLDTDTDTSGGSQSIALEVDSQIPAAVDGFSCVAANRRKGDVACQWTQSASGLVRYRVKYRTDGPLTDANWESATDAGAVSFSAAPQLSLQSLPLARTYHFGVRAEDNATNLSAISSQPGLLLDFTTVDLAAPAGNSGWGRAMAVGDFDCDGRSDLAVGDPGIAAGQGIVYIYLGTESGFSDRPFKSISGTVPGGQFGARLAGLPNFDKDAGGCADLAVYASHGDSPDGKVYLFLGRQPFGDRVDDATATPAQDTRLGAELVFQLPGSAGANEQIAGGLSSAGDFNADGASDLALSHHDNDGDTAEVWIVYGDESLAPAESKAAPQTRTLPGAAGVRVAQGKPGEGFGLALCGSGSLDGDGFSDLLIGAKGAPVEGSTRGKVYVVKGGAAGASLPETLSLGGARVTTIAGGESNGSFGEAVAFVGDMDGDGTAEFAASDTTVSGFKGAVYVFNLAASPADVSAATFTITNPEAVGADRLGVALGCAGFSSSGADLNQDGLADLITAATASGRIHQFNGRSALADLTAAAADHIFTAPLGSETFGAINLRLAKDVNGLANGFPDLLVGDPLSSGGSGRVVLFY